MFDEKCFGQVALEDEELRLGELRRSDLKDMLCRARDCIAAGMSVDTRDPIARIQDYQDVVDFAVAFRDWSNEASTLPGTDRLDRASLELTVATVSYLLDWCPSGEKNLRGFVELTSMTCEDLSDILFRELMTGVHLDARGAWPSREVCNSTQLAPADKRRRMAGVLSGLEVGEDFSLGHYAASRLLAGEDFSYVAQDLLVRASDFAPLLTMKTEGVNPDAQPAF